MINYILSAAGLASAAACVIILVRMTMDYNDEVRRIRSTIGRKADDESAASGRGIFLFLRNRFRLMRFFLLACLAFSLVFCCLFLAESPAVTGMPQETLKRIGTACSLLLPVTMIIITMLFAVILYKRNRHD